MPIYGESFEYNDELIASNETIALFKEPLATLSRIKYYYYWIIVLALKNVGLGLHCLLGHYCKEMIFLLLL